MESKLQRLLKEINLEEEYYEEFQNGTLDKVSVYENNKLWVFKIILDNILNIKTYISFLTKLKDKFNHIEEVELVITSRSKNYDNLKDYYNYYIQKICEKNTSFCIFKDRVLNLEENTITIDVYNKIEYTSFKKIVTDLKNTLLKSGFDIKEININIVEDEELKNKIKEEITTVPVKEKEVKIIKEEEIKDTKPKFRPKKDKSITKLNDILYEIDNITIEGFIFGIDLFEAKSGYKIFTLKVTDLENSIYVKLFTKDDAEATEIKNFLKKGAWYQFYGKVTKDSFAGNELVFMSRFKDIEKIEKTIPQRQDNAPKKRVELHVHTMMSGMDGLCPVDTDKHTIEHINKAIKWGHKAIAVTDHNGCQAFPVAYTTVRDYNKKITNEEDKFKVIYGTELTMIEDDVDIVIRPTDAQLLETTYVVFDFETTGFNAGGTDSIIDIGAVKICNGEIIDRFNELINPGRPLPEKITAITNITDDMLKDKDTEENAIKRFIDWYGNLPMVAHNAKFDVSFLSMCYKKYNLGEFKNTVIDTLELSRTLDNNFARHSLSALVKRYEVPWDEDAHHRADYDAEGTALVFHKMLKKLDSRNYETINDMNRLVAQDEIYKYGASYHINILAKNKVGLKNLFKLVSLANTKYLYKTPRILRSEITKHKEGLLIGSGCYEGEVFKKSRSKTDEELTNVINFYDYVEVQPPSAYDHLLQMNDFSSKLELVENIKKIIRVTMECGKLIVATGDVHYIEKEDKIYREIIVNQKVPGGGRHPLCKSEIKTLPDNHLRTTEEMLEEFSFLDEDIRNLIVIENPNKIADQVEIIEVIIETGGIPFSPKIENSVETVNQLVYDKAHSLYGEDLPQIIKERIDQELTGIIKGGFDVIYLIAQKLVKKSNDDGYLVGSRGSVGSSFVATMMGITEVNPLPAHYRCPNCKHSIFENEEGIPLGKDYSSGFDLPDKICPKCNTKMAKDGQDMPFATFLGFEADKVPDIDLNFSGDYQWKAHEYTKELFGIDNVYRAGTIGTVAEKTAFGFVKGYLEERGLEKRSVEIERLALGCTGVKRTTGQHPGGIVVIPAYMDVYDFTPYQYPADDANSLWRTTHFDYHAIDQDVLKLDILGHDDPTVLRMLQDLSGLDVTKIPLDDKDTMSIFTSPEILGVTKEQIMCETGTLGIPEMGTKFVIAMLVDTKPTTFSELIKISGLSHGTDVWVGNAQELIINNVVPFKEVIGCRDDIMVYLMYKGMKPKSAFKIMEFVRKGKASKEPDKWAAFEAEMKEAGIEEWFIDSCRKIKYMFPKAHAAAYVISAFRIAWFKVHKPIYYYCAYLSVRCSDFDIETMIKGYDKVKEKIIEIQNKGYEATNKESSILDVLYVALEMLARGFKFGNIDLYRSHSKNFVIDADEKTLIPPFRTIDGLGDTVANNIFEEAKKNPFISIEDFSKRCKVSATLVDKMRTMGILKDLPETSQLSLF